MSLFLYSCSSKQNSSIGGEIVDYTGESNAVWRQKITALKQGKPAKLRIIQIGDSHTAGDFFTGTLRNVLQQKLGNGGLGWVYPDNVKGQRMSHVTYHSTGWKSYSSRRDKNVEFPFGGVTILSDGIASVTLSTRQPTDTAYQISVLVKPLLANAPLSFIGKGGEKYQINAETAGNWRYHHFTAQLPLIYMTEENSLWQIGLFNIENKQSGVTVSALGINGAQLTEWKKWRTGWAQDLAQTKADLVILAYGTNEAFNDRLNRREIEAYWTNTIRRVKSALPKASILIIGAPEALQNQYGICGERAVSLTAMQEIQRNIAKKEKLLYWSWQGAMGGECSMKKWQSRGLANKDGVHFSAQGYRQSAQILAEKLLGYGK